MRWNVKQKNNKGITLIALVITIIVLLILATVSIATLTGENGILSKANTAKIESTIKSAEEKVKIAVMGSYGQDNTINLEELNINLKKIEGLTKIICEEKEIKENENIPHLPIKVIVDGYTFEIDEKGKVTRKAPVPKVTHTTNPPQEEQVSEGEKIVITIKATTIEGTITKIINPKGEETKNVDTITYEVTENGVYQFIVEGSNGTKTTHLVKIINGIGEVFSEIYDHTEDYIDSDGNTAKIPKGFAVGLSSTINKINKGLVITDAIDENHKSTGNQFVWIPVGNVKTTDGKNQNVVLKRYKFKGENKQEDTNNDVRYGPAELETPKYKNTIAKDINGFKNSTTSNGGYYIGRYEAGDSSTKYFRSSTSSQSEPIVCKANQIAYNYITQPQAATLCRKMYDKTEDVVTSDLVNSYAYDTALSFIADFSGNRLYPGANTQRPIQMKTGSCDKDRPLDICCNVFDMAGNYREYTTETSASSKYCSITRGPGFGDISGEYYAGYRDTAEPLSPKKEIAFRPVIYFKE